MEDPELEKLRSARQVKSIPVSTLVEAMRRANAPKPAEHHVADNSHANHASWTRDQILHLSYATLIFFLMAAAAVGLDLASTAMPTWGVSEFTSKALSYASHTILVLDLFLFGAYFLRTSYDLIRGLLK